MCKHYRNNKQLLYEAKAPYTRERFPTFLYYLLFSRESRTTSSLFETIQKRRKTFPCVRGSIFPLNTNLFEMIYHTLGRVFDQDIQTPRNLFENLGFASVFNKLLGVLDILMKHSSSCLLYYINNYPDRGQCYQPKAEADDIDRSLDNS